jgi:ribosomal protein L24E
MAKTVEVNQTLTTILKQLTSVDPLWRMEYRVQTIVAMNDNTLRLCCRTKERMVNVDIEYNPDKDLYNVTAYLLWHYGLGLAKIVEVTDVYWDSLADLLKAAHEDVPICNQCGQSVKPGSGRFVNRVPSFDNAETRYENNYPHPEGDFTCAECDQAED